MDGNRFLPLLGLPHTDPDVGATLRALQIMRDPQVAYKDEEDETTLQTQDFVGNLHLGFGAALGAGRAPHLASARGAIANSRLHERVHEHNAKARGARYTKTRRPVVLKSSWTCASRSEALKWEHAFKALNRSQKLDWMKRLAEDAT